MEEKSKVFTLESIPKHNTQRDCWLIIAGKVYDVTKFLEDHPGGDAVLLESAGKDATNDFEGVGHSTAAWTMMDEFYVGVIDPVTISSTVINTSPAQTSYNQEMQDKNSKQEKNSQFNVKLVFLVALAILGLAVAVGFYTKN